jgi:acetylornithine deacetylase/succinyl-diaminopimelate desuccinylase-like protein
MPLRRDALAGAAEMILAIERIAGADASDLVATVGRIEALPGAANVIAGEVRFTIDVRAGGPRGATGPPRRSWPKSPPSPRGAGWC